MTHDSSRLNKNLLSEKENKETKEMLETYLMNSNNQRIYIKRATPSNQAIQSIIS